MYIQLEAMRLKGKIAYEIDIAVDIDPENTLVPPLILQPLIENSIWHGLAPKEGPGRIWISIRRERESLYYVVEDNGVGRITATNTAVSSKRSMGIALTQARVAITGRGQPSDAEIFFTDLPNGLAVTVKLPLAFAF